MYRCTLAACGSFARLRLANRMLRSIVASPAGSAPEQVPVAPSSRHASRALLVGGVAMVILLGGLWLISVVLSNRNSVDLRLGDATFQGGDAEGIAEEIAERGPILYPDVSGERSRDIILQHLGDDPGDDWYAFRAQPPDKPRDCTWQWQPDEEQFRARCDRSLTAPADGEGLVRYPVRVVDDKLDADLNAADRTTTTVIETGGG